MLQIELLSYVLCENTTFEDPGGGPEIQCFTCVVYSHSDVAFCKNHLIQSIENIN